MIFFTEGVLSNVYQSLARKADWGGVLANDDYGCLPRR